MKKYVATVAMFIAMTSFSYGEDSVEIVNENNIDYVSLNTISKNLQGEVFEEEGKIGFRFKDQEILISKDDSFFLSNGKYKPVNVQEVDGFKVPCDTKVVLNNEQVYVPVSMLNDNYILRCYVEDNNFVIGEKEELKEPVGPVRPTIPQITPPSGITKPPVTPPIVPPVNPTPPVDPPKPEPEKPTPPPINPPSPEPEPPAPEPEPPAPKPEPPAPEPEPPAPEPEPPAPEPEPPAPEPEPPAPEQQIIE